MNALPAIVVIGYKRPVAIKRLLDSIKVAIYPSDSIPVVISLDGGYSSEVYDICERFKADFKYGTVEIIARSENLGLKNHVLSCGDFTNRFGSIILLEDDLYLDPQFYIYAKESALFYSNEVSVCGVSLYAQKYNETARLPFQPIETNYSTYFMMLACSWGQVWTNEQWVQFRNWYGDGTIEIDHTPIPANVKNWSDRSWKKYFQAYMVENDKYFVYPYRSYSTNFCDLGAQHSKEITSVFQSYMSLPTRHLDSLNFPVYESTHVSYDAYMEPCYKSFYEIIEHSKESLCVDLYGTKPISELLQYEHSLTIKSVTNPIKQFDQSLKPHDLSICVEGIGLKSISLARSIDVLDKTRPERFSYFLDIDIARLDLFFSSLVLVSKKIFNRSVSSITKVFSR